MTAKNIFLALVLICLLSVVSFAGGDCYLVPEVLPGGNAEFAGLKENDTLLSWSSGFNAKEFFFHDPFDWFRLHDIAGESSAILKIRRGEAIIFLSMPEDIASLEVAPLLDEETTLLYNEGLNLMNSGNVEKGMEQILHADNRIEKTDLKCLFLLAISLTLTQIPDYENALKLSSEALSLCNDLEDRFAESVCWKFTGDIYFQKAEWNKALDAYEQAITLAEGSPRFSVFLLERAANCGVKTLELQKAEDFIGKAGQICDELNLAGFSRILINESEAGLLIARSEYEKALNELQKNNLELKRFEEGGARSALNRMKEGEVYTYTNNQEKAFEVFRAIVEMCDSKGLDDRIRFDAINGMGAVKFKSGDMNEAEKYFLEAVSFWEKYYPNTILHGKLLSNLGAVSFMRSNMKGAEDYLEKANEVLRKVPYKNTMICVVNSNLAAMKGQKGDLESAEKYVREAIDVYLDIDPESDYLTGAYVNMSSIKHRQFDSESAEIYNNKALKLVRKKAPGSSVEAEILNNMGLFAQAEGDYEKAYRISAESLKIIENTNPSPTYIIIANNNLAVSAWELKKYELALGHLETALNAVSEKLLGGAEEATVYYNIGRVKIDTGDFEPAEKALERALEIQNMILPDSDRMAGTYFHLGRVNEMRGDDVTALDYYTKAVETMESYEARISDKQAIEGLSHKYADYYKKLIELQLKMKMPDDAFNTLESYRARGLLNMLAEREIDFSRDVPEELLTERKNINNAYDGIQARMASADLVSDAEELVKLRDEFLLLRDRKEEISDRIKKSSPRYGALQYPDPVGFEEAARLFSERDCFLSFCCLDDTTLAFLLKKGKLSILDLGIAKTDLNRLVRRYRNELEQPFMDDYRETSARLYSALIKPVRKYLKKQDTLVICPDGPLNLLPFETLISSGGKYLIEETSVSYLISATVYSEGDMEIAKRERKLAAFGDPIYPSTESGDSEKRYSASGLRLDDLGPLPGTAVEVDSISRLFPGESKIFKREKASEQNALGLDENYSYIHFACHGILDEHYPLNSGLVFSLPDGENDGRNGVLQAWEIYESLRINAEMVTLSACGTGLGKEMGGEGIVGLARAFIYAGAESVVSSLWSVEDNSTADLMTAFYRFLTDGEPRSSSLRNAKMKMIKSGNEYSHPFYWGAFRLYGGWE